MALLVVGCSNSSKPVALRYMVWDQNQAPAYQTIIDNFAKQNPKIQVNMQVIPWGNFWDKLFTEIAGGTPADVFWGYLPRVPILSQKGALLDLTERIKQDKIDLSKYNQSLVAAFQFQGKSYGLPKDWDTMALFYNKDLLKAAGYDSFPTDLAWNPQDGGTFLQFLEKLTVDKNGRHPTDAKFDAKNIRQYGFNYISTDIDPSDVLSLVASNGGTIMKDNKLAKDDALVGGLQFIYDLIFKYHVTPNYVDAKGGSSEAKFDAQQVAVWMTGSWYMKPVKQKASFAWGIAPAPKGPAGSIVRVNGLADFIYAKTPFANEAWKFVKFINSKQSQDILGSTGTVFPGNMDSIPSFVTYYQGLGIDPTVFVDEFKATTVVPPIALNYTEWYPIWIKYMSLVMSGQMSVKDGLDKLQAEGDPVAVLVK
jgi:multiple sugar transport system substrate-binding protein